MSTQYFTDVIEAAREGYNLDYIHVNVDFTDSGTIEYSVHVKIEGDKRLSHIHQSKLSLPATILEAVRRADFNNGRVSREIIRRRSGPVGCSTDPEGVGEYRG